MIITDILLPISLYTENKEKENITDTTIITDTIEETVNIDTDTTENLNDGELIVSSIFVVFA